MGAGLRDALLTADEMAKGKTSWKEFHDPFFGGDCVKLYWSMTAREPEEQEHKPEKKECGTNSFVFRENIRPFHPERLAAIIDPSKAEKKEKAGEVKKILDGVLKAKGSIWLANADTHPLNVQIDGREFEIEPNMSKPFLSSTLDAVAKNDWRDTFSTEWLAQLELVQASWQWNEASGDRASELIFKGANMDTETIEAGLRAALLTDEEIAKGKESWKELADPFFNVTFGDMAEEDEEVDDEEDKEEEEEGEEECKEGEERREEKRREEKRREEKRREDTRREEKRREEKRREERREKREERREKREERRPMREDPC